MKYRTFHKQLYSQSGFLDGRVRDRVHDVARVLPCVGQGRQRPNCHHVPRAVQGVDQGQVLDLQDFLHLVFDIYLSGQHTFQFSLYVVTSS